MNMVALIPARAGSRRCPGKNTRELAGHPLIAYTIAAAIESGVFSELFVCSDDPATYQIALQAGAIWWPRHDVPDDQPDVAWVAEFFRLTPRDKCPEAFAILRPTSPFRTAATIQRAYRQFKRAEVHSLRAVQPVKEHPGKMWEWAGPGYPMTPVLGWTRADGTPWHSAPTQTLPKFYVQNASLEMAWSYVVQSFGTISGKKIVPFFTDGYEGFDINDEDDFATAARLVAEGRVTLPQLPTRTPDQPTAA
jgi:CMP-N,N'-diacetyllegionaminic acid synthase